MVLEESNCEIYEMENAIFVLGVTGILMAAVVTSMIAIDAAILEIVTKLLKECIRLDTA